MLQQWLPWSCQSGPTVACRLYEDTFATPEDAEAFAISKALPANQASLLQLMQARKSLYSPNATLDNVLTLVFAIECIGVWYCMASADNLLFFIMCIVLADAIIRRFRDWGEAGGRWLSTWLHRRGFVSVDPLSGPIQLKKWTNQSWQLIVHVVSTAIEFYILIQEPWYDDPASLWIPFPYEQRHSTELQMLYIGALVRDFAVNLSCFSTD